MRVVVTGYKRSGTSLMMRILVECGFTPYYVLDHEHHKISSTTPNPYFFEDSQIMYDGFADGVIPKNHCVKVFTNGIHHVPDNTSVLYMYRPLPDIIGSLRKYKTEQEVAAELDIIKNLHFDLLHDTARFNNFAVVNFYDLVSNPRAV